MPQSSRPVYLSIRGLLVLVDLVVAEEFNFDCKPEIKVCEKRFVNLEYYSMGVRVSCNCVDA